MINYSSALGLGGLNPGQVALQTAGGLQDMQMQRQQMQQQQIQQQQQQEQQQATQQAAQQKQARISELLPLVSAGDYDASIEMAAIDPDMSNAINKAKAGMNDTQRSATAEWIANYQTAPDKDAFLAQDSPLDIDDAFREMPIEQREAMTRIMGAQLMPKEMFTATFGVESKPKQFQQGIGDMAGYSFDPNTGKFNINQNIKSRLEKAKSMPFLDAKTRQSINKDITQLSKDTKLIRNTAADLDKLSKIKSGPASIAMVFKFMKALDPTSVVREGEFLTAERSAGMPEAMRNMYNKIMEGGRLGPEQIKQFVYTAKQLSNSSIESSNTEINSFLATFEDTIPESFKSSIRKRIPAPFGIDSAKAVSDKSTPKPAPKSIRWEDLP